MKYQHYPSRSSSDKVNEREYPSRNHQRNVRDEVASKIASHEYSRVRRSKAERREGERFILSIAERLAVQEAAPGMRHAAASQGSSGKQPVPESHPCKKASPAALVPDNVLWGNPDSLASEGNEPRNTAVSTQRTRSGWKPN